MSIGRRLSTEEKKEIFSDLVATQDAVVNVRKSYEMVTERFSISEEQLRAIEEEGLDNEWPPLSEPVSAH
jgi:crotonobetainyl-CoA:carnitine CoA-transferase CaiB-like acyl-CoA transferase